MKKLIIFSCIFCMFILGCTRELSPSRGIEIDLSIAQASQEQVVSALGTFFKERGFHELGESGYEELTGEKLSLSYENDNGMNAYIGLGKSKVISIRINTQEKHWSENANKLFNELVLLLELNWPKNSIRLEPVSSN